MSRIRKEEWRNLEENIVYEVNENPGLLHKAITREQKVIEEIISLYYLEGRVTETKRRAREELNVKFQSLFTAEDKLPYRIS